MSRDAFKTYVVVNPNSSNGRTGKIWPALRDAIGRTLGPFEHGFTAHPGHGAEIAAHAAAHGFEMVVSLGGDGTHNEVANGLLSVPRASRPVLAVVTSGTGGDFRRTFGFDKGPAAGIAKLAGRKIRRIDAGRFSYLDHEGRTAQWHFVNILSFGISGLVDHVVNTSSKALGGKVSFFLATVRALTAFRQQTVAISLDGGPYREIAIHNLAIANGRFFGGGMMVAPQAEPDDGQLDVVSFEDMSTARFLSLAGSIYKGAHLTRPNVKFARAAAVSVKSDQRVLIDVDGEQKGTLPLEVEVLPGELELKV